MLINVLPDNVANEMSNYCVQLRLAVGMERLGNDCHCMTSYNGVQFSRNIGPLLIILSYIFFATQVLNRLGLVI